MVPFAAARSIQGGRAELHARNARPVRWTRWCAAPADGVGPLVGIVTSLLVTVSLVSAG